MDMLGVAQGRGIRVQFGDLGERHGEYGDGVITINERRPEEVQRIILAHELGHAWHDHQATVDPRRTAKQEREADEHAVRLLVDRFAYEKAERMYGPSVGAVAAELGLPARMVETLRGITRRDEWGERCGFVA